MCHTSKPSVSRSPHLGMEMQVVVQNAAQGLQPYTFPSALKGQQDPGADQDTFFDKPVRVI